MAVKTAQQGNVISQDTSRGPSNGVWSDCPLDDFIQNFGGGIGTPGYLVQDDFCPVATPSNVTPAIGTLGQWAVWAAATMTIVDAIEEGGVAKISGTAANTSFILTSNAGMFRLVGATANFNLFGKLWFECRLALGSVSASQQGVFVGLADNTGSQINSSNTTVIASGGNTLTTTKNILGLFNRTTTGPADFSVVYQPAAGTAVYPTGLTTLVNSVTGANMKAYAADTDIGHGTGFVKLGMKFDPNPQQSLLAPASPPSGQTAGTLYPPNLTFYVNGQQLPFFLNKAILQAATFPTGCVFSPVIQYMNVAGAGAPIYVDWIRIAQLASF
jgi:hypothetical protein